jgi:uncharacterized protein (DUF3084 family)
MLAVHERAQVRGLRAHVRLACAQLSICSHSPDESLDEILPSSARDYCGLRYKDRPRRPRHRRPLDSFSTAQPRPSLRSGLGFAG